MRTCACSPKRRVGRGYPFSRVVYNFNIPARREILHSSESKNAGEEAAFTNYFNILHNNQDRYFGSDLLS